MTTRTRDDLLIWQFSIRIAGVLEPQARFQVGFDSEHARELLTASLVAEYGEHRYSINPDALWVEQNELPDSLGLFGKLQRQRDELFPPPPRVPSGPIFVFWLQNEQGGKSRHIVVDRLESREAARESAAKHAAANELRLLGGVEQLELSELLASKLMAGRSDSELFSRLTPSNARILAEMLREAYALEWAKFGERIAREARELYAFPDREKLPHKAPRPSVLTQAAFAVLEHSRPREESPSDKRARLEARRREIHAGA